MRITVGELKQFILEALHHGDTTVHTADGKYYEGMRTAIERALLNFGTSRAERDAIMSGQVPISSAALSALRGSKAVKPAAREFQPKPYREPRPKGMSERVAGDKFRVAARKFARNWTHFTEESPDIPPEDAAYDAADGFFWENPDWQKWAHAMHMSKQTMQEVIADYVYDAMTTGKVS